MLTFEEPNFSFTYFLYFSILYPPLIFIILLLNFYFFSPPFFFLLFLALCLVCSFSSYLRCTVRLFVWALSSLLKQVFTAVHFPVGTVFAASRKFWKVVFLFSLISRYFPIFVMTSSLTLWLFKVVLC